MKPATLMVVAIWSGAPTATKGEKQNKGRVGTRGPNFAILPLLLLLQGVRKYFDPKLQSYLSYYLSYSYYHGSWNIWIKNFQSYLSYLSYPYYQWSWKILIQILQSYLSYLSYSYYQGSWNILIKICQSYLSYLSYPYYQWSWNILIQILQSYLSYLSYSYYQGSWNPHFAILPFLLILQGVLKILEEDFAILPFLPILPSITYLTFPNSHIDQATTQRVHSETKIPDKIRFAFIFSKSVSLPSDCSV